MKDYRMVGTDLYDYRSQKIAIVRNSEIWDTHSRKVGNIRDYDVYNDRYQKLVSLRGMDVFDDHNNRIISVHEIKRMIEGSVSDIVAVALWYFFIREGASY